MLTAGVLALTLGGCVTLLPKSEPALLYRFGEPPAPAAAETPPLSGAVGVYHANGEFQRESAGDRILTITGARAAYIAGSRWVAPAEVLFDEAVTDAFAAGPGRVRLLSRSEAGHTAYTLRLDVRDFETQYGAGRAPSVLVRVRALLTRNDTRAPVAERVFEVRAPAARNRVSAIVAAYDEAVGKVLHEIVAWTDSSVA